MVNPVPGYRVSTPYGRRGQMWRACGFHTGVDFAAPAGTKVVAAISGTIRHRNYGDAFGRHQFSISPGRNQPFSNQEVFYAHCSERLPDGTEVVAGQTVSKVGFEGNVSPSGPAGAHLHFEFHSRKNAWSCDVVKDPTEVIEWKETNSSERSRWSHGDVYQSKLKFGQKDSDSVKRLQWVLNQWSFKDGVELRITGNYDKPTKDEVAKFQVQICHDVGDGFIGPRQTSRLFVKGGPWNIVY